MPATRRKTLFVLVPFGVVLGVFALVSEVVAHGGGVAVVTGLVAGACVSTALFVLLAARWGPRSEAEKAAGRRMWQQTHAASVSIGLLGAGVVSAVGAIFGSSTRGLGIFAMTGIGVVFLAGSAILALAAIKLPQLWD